MSAKRSFGTCFVIFSILACILLCGLVAIPAVSPSTGAFVADVVRGVTGPDFTAELEKVSFRILDSLRQVSGFFVTPKPEITVQELPTSLPTPTSTAFPTLTATPVPVIPSETPIPAKDVVSADPEIGWQAYGPTFGDVPVMAQAVVAIDPTRPYAGIALVRIDLTRVQIHVMPGFLEPSHKKEITDAIPNMGVIPMSDQAGLIAAFNGGFKAVNGQYGMTYQGIEVLPPVDGIATLAIYRDGSVKLGMWGVDIVPDENIVSLRQNCPPIIFAGQINPLVYVDDRYIWGRTIENSVVTWRTGVGLSGDGKYLIYAVGNATSVATLAQALQMAGATNAMQLDINRHYAHFVTYEGAKAVRLLLQMEDRPDIYLVPNSRDFFYITVR